MSSQPKAGRKSFTPGSTAESRLGRPESVKGPNQAIKRSTMETPAPIPAKGRSAGDFKTPTSVKSNIVSPATAGPKVKDPGITNKGA